MGTLAAKSKNSTWYIKRVPQCYHIGSTAFIGKKATCFAPDTQHLRGVTRTIRWNLWSNLGMYVCMYSHRFQQSIDEPGEVANPARGQLDRENDSVPVPVRA